MAVTLCELQWLSQLLSDLRVFVPCPIPLYFDNQAAIHFAANPMIHEQTKHIEIDCHFVRDAFPSGIISPRYLRSDIQPADIFTKALQPSHFFLLARKLGIHDPHAPN